LLFCDENREFSGRWLCTSGFFHAENEDSKIVMTEKV
jgi:hypothetical protein